MSATNEQIFLIIFYRNISADLEKAWYTKLSIANVGKWRKAVDNKEAFLTDLSKAFDCLSHEL